MKTLLLTERELQQVIALLVESKKEEFLKKKYNVSDDIINKLKEIDPTPNNKYLEWLIKTEVLDSWWTHRRPKISQYLSYYSKDNIRKSLPKEYQDINRIDGISDFIKIMEKVKPDDFISKSEAYDQTYKGRAGKYKVYQPTTYAQSCKLGSGTRWCTSADSDEGRRSFKEYTEDDELFIFIDGDDKYQYSTQGGEFKDYANNDADMPDDILRWLAHNGYKELTLSEKIDILGMSLEEALDGDLHVEGDLSLRFNRTLKQLPDGLRVGGNLDLYHNKAIKELPNGLRVDGSLYLEHTKIEKLPNDLYVGRHITLYYNKRLKELPNGLRVEGYLDIGNTNIKKLPNDLYVRGDLMIMDTPLTKYTDNEIKSMVKHIGGGIKR